jgi:cell division protein ZapA (FtsZ GTPase activity inhibitor)
MAEVALKVLIGGRVYPLTVKKEEEEQVLGMAKAINDKMKEFELNYSVRDKQDLLAMSALNLLVAEQNSKKNSPVIEEELFQLNSFISDYLQKEATID